MKGFIAMYSDNYLIKKIIRTKDSNAANELLSRYYKIVYAFVFRQVHDETLSMDLTQDIFIAVMRTLENYDRKKSKFSTWLYVIASHKITDYYRSRYHHQAILQFQVDSLDEFTNSEREEEKLLNDCYKKELIEKIMKIVMQYDDEWISIFQSKIFLSMTFDEIASSMGLSVNTIKTRYYTMLKYIRKEFEDEE